MRPTIIDHLITICITKVKCGTNHVIALSSDNKVYVWGSSSYGQLGLGHEKFCNAPMLIEFPKELIIKEIFAKHNSSALLLTNGDLLVCGENAYGKLGVHEDKVLYFKKSLVKDKIMSITIGYNHSMIITQNNKTIGMGTNTDGQLGVGHCKPCKYPQNPKFLLNITTVACGETFTAAGTDCNAVYIWGKTKESTSAKYLPKENGLKVESEVSEIIMKPKCILALYASKERLKAGHKIWLETIAVVQNNLFILVNTTAPPPMKKNNNNRSNVPDWMDTNIDFTQTTLPNTPQFT